MLCNSMCGYSLQKGSKIIAVIDLIIGILVTAYMLFTLIVGYLGDNESEFRITAAENINGTEHIENERFLTVAKLDRIVIILVYISVEYWLFRLLFNVSKHQNKKGCMSWIKVRGIVLLLWTVYVLYGATTGKHETIEMTLKCMIILYRIYEIGVVAELRKEIKKTDAAPTKQALTEQDEFA